jgi:hypothetical protein
LSFDDPNLVSTVGLVPLLALAERAALSELITDRVSLDGGCYRRRVVRPPGGPGPTRVRM